MKFAGRLRTRYGENVLIKKIKQQKRTIQSCNIDNAQSIGILFNATHSVSFEIIKNLVKDLSEKKRTIMVLGFVDSKQLIDHYLYRKGFEFFTRKELNWYEKPESEAVTEFMKKDFDLLISLSLQENYPLKYILSLSKAKFKVGRLTTAHDSLDLMIDIDKEIQAMNDLQKELQSETEKTKPHLTSFDSIADIKTSVELQTNFLINQLLHYLSKLK